MGLLTAEPVSSVDGFDTGEEVIIGSATNTRKIIGWL